MIHNCIDINNIRRKCGLRLLAINTFHGEIGIGIINLDDMPSNSTRQKRVKDNRLPEASVAQ